MFSKKTHKNIYHKIYSISGLCVALLAVYLLSLYTRTYQLTNIESTKVYDNHDVLLYDVRDEYRHSEYTTFDEIPAFFTTFIVEKEDQRFWEHQ